MWISLHQSIGRPFKIWMSEQNKAGYLKYTSFNKETVNENTLTCVPYTHVPICTLTCTGI
jgi:hypothetical protein